MQFSAAGLLALAAIILATFGVWLFRAPSQPASASVWRLLLSDRTTLGFLKLAILLLSLYAIASIGALAVSGRWIKGFSTSGVEADASFHEATLQRAEQKLAQVKAERDEALRVIWRLTGG